MKKLIIVVSLLLLLVACKKNEASSLSIENKKETVKTETKNDINKVELVGINEDIKKLNLLRSV